MKNTKKGFTLIELLVVIAIIGILSAVVLASLNSARNKGADAAIKSSVNNARAQAELFAEGSNGEYDGVCAAASSATPGGVATMVAGATSSGSGAVACADAVGGWAISAQLKSNTGLYYCVDSTGKATTTTASGITAGTGSADYACL